MKRLFFEKKKTIKKREFEDTIMQLFTKAVNINSSKMDDVTGDKNRVADAEILMRYYSHTKSLWFEENQKVIKY